MTVFRRRSLSVTLTIVACLGFGMGAVTIIYSWYAGLLLHPLPAVHRMDELVTVRAVATGGWTLSSLPDYRDWRDQAQSVSGLAATSLMLFGVSVTGAADDRTEPVYGAFASANYLGVLGVGVPVGRDFQPADDAPAHERIAVLVSDRFWKRRLGGRPDVVGRPIRINGQQAEIVGVAAPGFGGVLAGVTFDIWVPIAARAALVPMDEAPVESRTHRWLDIIGRRRPDRSLDQVRAEFASIGRRRADAYPEHRGRTIDAGPLDTGTIQMLRPMFASFLALTSIALLIVCSNVANLLLLRGASRVREIAIRFALGATRARIVGQLMIENVSLAAAGAALALVLSYFGRRALTGIAPATTVPLDLDVPLDLGVLWFLVALASVTVVLFGLLPALLTSRLRIADALAGGTRGTTGGRSRLRRVLVAAQFALCLATLVGAGLFLRGAEAIRNLETGFSGANRVLLIQTESALAGYRNLRDWQIALDAIAERVRALPGVRSATWATFVPLGFVGYTRRDVGVEGHIPQTGESLRMLVSGVGDEYFEVMGIPILEGRPIDADDRAERPGVAVVNEAFARRFWPASSAIGRRVTIDNRQLTIVGVAKGGRYDYRVFDEPHAPFVYYALAQSPGRFVTLHARTDGDPVAMVPAVREAIAAVSPAFATLAPMSLENYVAGPMMPFRIGLVFLSLLGLVALGLAVMGLRAIVAYDVAVRTREIGIRLTLGALPGQIAGIFLRQSLWMTGLGVTAGLLLALALVPVFRAQTGYRGAVEAGLMLWPMLLLTTVGLAAGHLTAWRATRVDPARTLREE